MSGIEIIDDTKPALSHDIDPFRPEALANFGGFGFIALRDEADSVPAPVSEKRQGPDGRGGRRNSGPMLEALAKLTIGGKAKDRSPRRIPANHIDAGISEKIGRSIEGFQPVPGTCVIFDDAGIRHASDTKIDLRTRRQHLRRHALHNAI